MIARVGVATTGMRGLARAPYAMSSLLNYAAALAVAPLYATQPIPEQDSSAPPPTDPAPVQVTVTTPPPAPPPPPCPYEVDLVDHAKLKSANGMLAAGISIGVATYLTTSMAGAVAIDRARDFEDDPLTEEDESARGDDRRAFGRALLIPVAGPFVAIGRADTALRGWAAGMSGVAQGVAVGLTLAGLVRRSAAKHPRNLAVAPAAGSGHAGVVLQGRF